MSDDEGGSRAPGAGVDEADGTPSPEVAVAHTAPLARVRGAIVPRLLGIALGGALVVFCVLAAITALSFFILLLGPSSSAQTTVSPNDVLRSLLGGTFTVILLGIGVRYLYYYFCWYTSRRYFTRPAPPAPDVLAARDIPYLKFQVTTKGGALPVVERSLRVLEMTCNLHPWLARRVSAEVITERADESAHLERAFSGSSLQVTAITLPADYSTPNGSRLKARALHHLVERRREGFNRKPGKTYIVHLDEETVMTEPHVLVLVDYLTTGDPRPITQGPILYPLEWGRAPAICRALECARPFGCSECTRVMKNPPPPHLHGSNLVVAEDVEDVVGWDFGTLEGEAFVAEDLLFGLRAYAVLGEEAFGWHGATMLEQPPLSLFWAIRQRLRWVLGALQGLRAMWMQSDYAHMPTWRKARLSLSVYARIATYSLGFPVGLAGIVFAFEPLRDMPDAASAQFQIRVLLLIGAVGWILSYQIGLQRNLMYQSLHRWQRVEQHVLMLVATPIVGMCETIGPFLALVRWVVGSRRASWTPTPKVAEATAAAVTAATAPAALIPSTATPAVHLTAGGAAVGTVTVAAAAAVATQGVEMPAWLKVSSSAPDMPPPEAVANEPVPIRWWRALRSLATEARRPAPRTPVVLVGRWAAAVGTIALLFLAYEYLATPTFANLSQRSLLTAFQQDVRTQAAGAGPASDGDPVALLSIPRIGLQNMVVVEGTTPEDLKSGPGHLGGSPMPGEYGNAVLVGRRTTYGGPFRDLDRLSRGDRFTVVTGQGTFQYEVTALTYSGADDVTALDGQQASQITLVTSDPAYLPRGRLDVVARLHGNPLDVPTVAQVPLSAADLGLAGDYLGLGLALFWAVLLAAVLWARSRVRRRLPPRVLHMLWVPVLLTLLLLMFTGADRLLPGTL